MPTRVMASEPRLGHVLVRSVGRLGRQTAAIVHAPQMSYRSRQNLEERDHPTHIVLVDVAVKEPSAFFSGNHVSDNHR